MWWRRWRELGEAVAQIDFSEIERPVDECNGDVAPIDVEYLPRRLPHRECLGAAYSLLGLQPAGGKVFFAIAGGQAVDGASCIFRHHDVAEEIALQEVIR
jgi:hypothetical protein